MRKVALMVLLIVLISLPVYAEIRGIRFRRVRHAEPRLVMGVECGQAPHRLVACRYINGYVCAGVWFQTFYSSLGSSQVRL
jgi:hypothetical protein